MQPAVKHVPFLLAVPLRQMMQHLRLLTHLPDLTADEWGGRQAKVSLNWVTGIRALMPLCNFLWSNIITSAEEETKRDYIPLGLPNFRLQSDLVRWEMLKRNRIVFPCTLWNSLLQSQKPLIELWQRELKFSFQSISALTYTGADTFLPGGLAQLQPRALGRSWRIFTDAADACTAEHPAQLRMEKSIF